MISVGKDWKEEWSCQPAVWTHSLDTETLAHTVAPADSSVTLPASLCGFCYQGENGVDMI